MADHLEQSQDSASAKRAPWSGTVNPAWPPERLAQLVGLVATMSVAAAARVMGCTKNMAIGALDRAANRREYQKPKDPVPPWRPPEPKPGGCRYIAGDPAKPGWAWCDERVHRPGSPWCAHHLAVVRPSPRAQREEW